MKDLQHYSHLVETELGAISFPNAPENLYDPLRYFLKLGGKRMRPILTLMGAEAFGADASSALPAALSIELFHNFSLIHDDIMDEAPIRRGRETVHCRWNQSIAILSGDVLLVKAYQFLARQKAEVLVDLMTVFNATAVEVCEGQQLDMDFEKRENVAIAEYIEMIRLKTSVLLGCALEMGAIIAKAAIADRKFLFEFGQQIGIAFQIQDDILDLYADPDKFGKQVGGDIISNKKTLLLLKAVQLSDDSQKKELEKIMRMDDLDSKINAAKRLFDALGVRTACTDIMNHHYSLAKQALSAIQLPKEKLAPLLEVAELLMVREV
jgi:geranylgeranyl diphosphate synthase, type II